MLARRDFTTASATSAGLACAKCAVLPGWPFSEEGGLVLRDTDVRGDFERITSGLSLGVGLRVRRWGWTAAAVGVGLEMVGVIVFVFGRDAGQSAGGGSFSSTHIGQFLLLAGLAVATLGALAGLFGPYVYGHHGRSSLAARLPRVAAPVLAVVLVAGGVLAVQRTALRDKAVTVVSAANSATSGTTADGLVSTNPDVIAAAAIPDQPLDAATRDKLASQLTLARQVALQYPTAADAQRAGMYLAGGFAPGSGAHYVWTIGALKGIQPDGEVDPHYPGSFIYDGTSPTSRIVGLMYLSLAASAPQGFAGPNDHWHRHFNLCIIQGAGTIKVPFPADADVSKAQCDAVHGDFMKQSVWMLHTWVVPAWESPDGVFSHANRDLRCADGTYDADAQGFCQGT
jgi:hypothetical protein